MQHNTRGRCKRDTLTAVPCFKARQLSEHTLLPPPARRASAPYGVESRRPDDHATVTVALRQRWGGAAA
eukprot:3863184-Prymnesium_polylepis.2